VLIALNFDCLRLSLCNLYAPNNVSEQLQFIQELNSFLIDKAEPTALIVGGDWNCTLSRKDKKGGARWKPTSFRNAVLIKMDVFDLIDIQREKYPNVNKYSYLSKALDVKSRINFLLVAKNLTKYVKKSDIQPSIAPDHCAVYIFCLFQKSTPGDQVFGNLITRYLLMMNIYRNGERAIPFFEE